MSLIDLPGEQGRLVVNPLHLVLGERARDGRTDLHMLTNLTRTLDPGQSAKFWRRVERIDRGEEGSCEDRDLSGRSAVEPILMPPDAPGESAPSAGTSPGGRPG